MHSFLRIVLFLQGFECSLVFSNVVLPPVLDDDPYITRVDYEIFSDILGYSGCLSVYRQW